MMEKHELPVTVMKYETHEIAFQTEGLDLWIDATAMAKPFGKKPYEFLRLADTIEFVEAYQNREMKKQNEGKNMSGIGQKTLPASYYSPFKTIEGGANAGTFFNRVLSLKFAAWLSKDFELWVFETIDRLLNEERLERVKQIETMAARRVRKTQLLMKLETIPEYNELQEIMRQEQREANQRRRKASKQLTLFIENKGWKF